jgi:predicted O-methyltransferase YrrM
MRRRYGAVRLAPEETQYVRERMDAAIQTVLQEFEARAERESALMHEMPREEWGKHVDEWLLPVGPDVGRLMNMLIKASGALSILEIGTSHGYSTIWMAEAARETGGVVITLDLSGSKQAYARERVRQAGLAGQVEFVLGDALQTLGELTGPFDFVLLDLWKNLYTPCFELFYPKLNAGALIVADNVTYPEDVKGVVKAYQARVRTAPGMDSLMVPIGNGIELSRFSG